MLNAIPSDMYDSAHVASTIVSCEKKNGGDDDEEDEEEDEEEEEQRKRGREILLTQYNSRYYVSWYMSFDDVMK